MFLVRNPKSSSFSAHPSFPIQTRFVDPESFGSSTNKVMEMLLSEIEIVTHQQLWTMKDNTEGDLKV